LAQNECEKLVLPNYFDKKLQICKMRKLHIFVITNICNQILVTLGSIGIRVDKMGSQQSELFFAKVGNSACGSLEVGVTPWRQWFFKARA
jgi:hypothetical protein